MLGGMMRIAILIDGGHLRALARNAGYKYDPDFIETVALACVNTDESVLRILYYDCAPFAGKAKLPVSGELHEFKGSDTWLQQLAAKDLFAVRRGVLKFRGFKPKTVPVSPAGLTDNDFKPDFEQKGVDMRIGLDIATFSRSKAVERIVLITADTDCIPAMKHGRIAGLQVVLVTLGNQKPPRELLWHSDFERRVTWPPAPSGTVPMARASRSTASPPKEPAG
jgi:uncharacterized LabA/DUF88 family protein